MKSPSHDASARQHFGEPFSGLSANDARRDRLHNQDLAEVDGEIARLVDRSTEELRRAWRTLYHTGPPPGLSRDLIIIRGLADKLQQRAHGGPSRALRHSGKKDGLSQGADHGNEGGRGPRRDPGNGPSPLKATYRGKDPGIMHLVFLLRPMPMTTPRGDLVGQVLPQIQRRRPCSALSGPNIGRQNRPL
jgi:hypothetical protein